MNRILRRIIALLLVAMLVSTVGTGCGVYFNTFFNCRKAFNSAEKARKDGAKNNRPASSASAQYNVAIDKALKVIENHPNSKYYDDALFILAVSYYHTQQYSRAERRFREIIAEHGDTKYARESKVYLAKAKLALGDAEDAAAIFEEVFQQKYEKRFKAEAAEALGQYHYDRLEYDQSREYFMAIRDSLGENFQKILAQQYIADGYFERFKFSDALGAYLQLLGMDPNKDQKYHALYRAALCSYRLLRINAGMEYLEKLIDDEAYYDSLGALELTVAEGLESEDDLLAAEAVYKRVATTAEKKEWQGKAYYQLGLMYQFMYDDLNEAKRFYDKAAESFPRKTDESARDALQRSSDIGKLSTYARTDLDSTATQEEIDNAALTQYRLAELYWFSLSKPDSAIAEMQYMVDSFPGAYNTPQGLIALSQMYREELEDEKGADSLLKLVLTKYPHSDFVPEALSLLGLKGTAADTGYAELYMHRAEDFLVDEEKVDSARANYQRVVDNYPDSKFYLQARFNLIWLTENYAQTGDSSVYYAYQAFADTFGTSELAREALQRIGRSGGGRQQRHLDDDRDSEHARDEELAANGADAAGVDTTSPAYIDPREALYYRPNGDTLIDLKLEPIEIVIPFEYPAQASTGNQYDWKLYFQILIDFSGKVIDYKLAIPTGIPEIDERASETVESMTFDALDVSNRLVSAGKVENTSDDGNWFVFEYDVVKPEYLR